MAPKTLEWYVIAVARFPLASWVGKIDDDSAVNLRRLHRDVLDMQAASGASGASPPARAISPRCERVAC